jgi:hypothetical protein
MAMLSLLSALLEIGIFVSVAIGVVTTTIGLMLQKGRSAEELVRNELALHFVSMRRNLILVNGKSRLETLLIAMNLMII